MKHTSSRVYTIVRVAIIGLVLLGSALTSAQLVTNSFEKTMSVHDEEINDNAIIVDIPISSYQIEHTLTSTLLSLDNYGHNMIPGYPDLPSRIYSIAIPPGTTYKDITVCLGKSQQLSGIHYIDPVPLSRVIGNENPELYKRDKQQYEQSYNQVYTKDALYPSTPVEFIRTAGYRKYNLVDVRVTPFQYHPQDGHVMFYPDITVTVEYTSQQKPSPIINDDLPRTETFAASFILNYDQAQQWYPPMAMDAGLHDFVIITLDSLVSSVSDLVAWETAKGRTVEVVTTSWISTTYTGYDLAEKIRNFLREKYPSEEWGIQDVLLVGHYDNVPMRRCDQDLGYGEPETDFYYAELSLPDSESWDANGNHQWGEDTDPIDFYAEVNVGRIPWSSPSTVQNICEKSVDYEQNSDPSFKKNILLLGAFFWDDDPNPRTDNAVLMETKVNQPWMSDWTMTRMYEQGYSTYPMDYDLTHTNVVNVWSAGTYGFVNWAGHGSPTACYRYHPSTAFIDSGDCSSLNDDHPAIIFANACSNSDTDYLNIGQAMMQQGAVGFVGATKVALGQPGWDSPYDGSSQSMDYIFTVGVTSGEYTIGQAHQYALQQMYALGLWSYDKYETFEWGALWGNPDLAMFLPSVKIILPDPLPTFIDPGVPTPISVQLTEISDTYVPDSGLLHYRFDGGTYNTVGFTHLGGDLYEAILPPASCGDQPEFYFTIETESSGMVTNPIDAPTTVYSVNVGELVIILTDDFETDTGWEVYAGADTGDWERANPQEVSGSAGISQPEDDHTPDGTLCFVTGPLAGSGAGSYDVDGGPTILTSPVYDLDGIDAIIGYWRWYHISTQWNDEFVVEVSNDNGDSWVTVETVDDRETWRYVEWKVSDYVIPTNQVRVRFVADDSPNDSLVEALVDDFIISAISCEENSYVLDGEVFENDGITPHLDPMVTVTNLNTQTTWEATVLEGDSAYTLELTSGADVSVDDILRIIARDDTHYIDVTDYTVTQSDVDSGGTTIDMILDVYYFDIIDFPMYQAQGPDYTKMCGPAVMQMLLNYMWWNQTQEPSGPPMLFDDQNELYDLAHVNNSDPDLDLLDSRGIWKGLNQLRPLPYSEYGYNFNRYHNTDPDVIVKLIAEWIDYPIGTYGGYKPGHPLHVPGALPMYGDYTNWMAVRGIHTNHSAFPLPDALTVYGFWLNDPVPSGIGENTYKTIDEFLTSYQPLTGIDSEDEYYGEYVAIMEPPQTQQQPTITYALPSPQFLPRQQPFIKLAQQQPELLPMSLKTRIITWVTTAATQGVTEELLRYNNELQQLFDDLDAGDPLFVHSLSGEPYYLVPFNTQDGLTHMVVRLRADDGRFLEASWVQEPVDYLPVTEQDAVHHAYQFLEEQGISLTEPDRYSIQLEHLGGSPFTPVWSIQFDGVTVIVTQTGDLSI